MLLLVLITLGIYLPVIRHDFVTYDDIGYVTNNQIVQNGLTLAGIKWAFTTLHMANWHPITWVSHMADCELFKLNAGAHHFVNVLFHAANVALLFTLLLRLTKKMWPSALVAALFAWHPLHVESVAWISERKDVLSTFFGLLSLLNYARYAQEQDANSRKLVQKSHPHSLPLTSHSKFYWLALVFFALGLMSKPMLVTLPFILLLLDYWPLARFSLSAFPSVFLTEKLPFFLLAAASCVFTFLAQQAGHSIASLDEIPLPYRLENALAATAQYLLKMLWPVDLAVIYPLTIIQPATWMLALAVLILTSAGVWLAHNHNRCWLAGWFWFLGTLVPVIGIVQVGGATMADRYTYIPSIGIFIAVVFGLHSLPRLKIIFPVVSTLALIACVLLTEKQLGYWRNSETLFRHTLAVTENNEIAHLNLGVALDQQGRTTEALAEYREAMRIYPANYQIHFAIGNMLFKMNRPAEALVEYRECLRLDPGVPALYNAAASALVEQGKIEDARKEFAEAERLDSHYAQPHLELAKTYFTQGQDAQAVAELWSAARSDPYNVEVLIAVARYLAVNENAAARDGQQALTLALKANDLSGNRQSDVFDVLGMAFAATGDFTNAVVCAQNALEFAPDENQKNIGPLRQRLKFYENHQPWHESFRATNAPALR